MCSFESLQILKVFHTVFTSITIKLILCFIKRTLSKNWITRSLFILVTYDFSGLLCKWSFFLSKHSKSEKHNKQNFHRLFSMVVFEYFIVFIRHFHITIVIIFAYIAMPFKLIFSSLRMKTISTIKISLMFCYSYK